MSVSTYSLLLASEDGGQLQPLSTEAATRGESAFIYGGCDAWGEGDIMGL